jgi:hypothetical protein
LICAAALLLGCDGGESGVTATPAPAQLVLWIEG